MLCHPANTSNINHRPKIRRKVRLVSSKQATSSHTLIRFAAVNTIQRLRDAFQIVEQIFTHPAVTGTVVSQPSSSVTRFQTFEDRFHNACASSSRSTSGASASATGEFINRSREPHLLFICHHNRRERVDVQRTHFNIQCRTRTRRRLAAVVICLTNRRVQFVLPATCC